MRRLKLGSRYCSVHALFPTPEVWTEFTVLYPSRQGLPKPVDGRASTALSGKDAPTLEKVHSCMHSFIQAFIKNLPEAQGLGTLVVNDVNTISAFKQKGSQPTRDKEASTSHLLISVAKCL